MADYDKNQCFICPTFIHYGICYSECPLNTYADKTSKVCNDCHPTCQTCRGPYDTQCNLSLIKLLIKNFFFYQLKGI